MTEFSRTRTPVRNPTSTRNRREPWEGYRQQYREIMSESPESFGPVDFQRESSHDDNTDIVENTQDIGTNIPTPSFLQIPKQGDQER